MTVFTFSSLFRSRWFLSFLLALFSSASLLAQEDSTNVYKVNHWWSLGIGTVGLVTNIFGVKAKLDKESVPLERVLALRKEDVNPFDRLAFKFDIKRQGEFDQMSDYGLYAGFYSPLLILLDKDMRSDWADIFSMYFEAQAISANLYSWSLLGPTLLERFRPGTYYEEKDLSYRTSGRRLNSWFSGHVSSTATGSFFFAKVFIDYHPELDSRKWLVYGAALIPPLFTGYYRVAAAKHFPTDVIGGIVIGGAMGILIPHLHKRFEGKDKFAAFYDADFKGLSWIHQF